MIFTSLVLLVVATALLIGGIVKSSVALLILSVIATLAGCATLYASFALYRRTMAAEQAAATGATTAVSATDPMPGAVPTTPASAVPTPLLGTSPPAGNGVGNGSVANGSVANGSVAAGMGWDHLDETRAVQLVDTLNLDELHDLRRYEIEHAQRGAVLAAIDGRIEAIVAVRRSATGV